MQSVNIDFKKKLLLKCALPIGLQVNCERKREAKVQEKSMLFNGSRAPQNWKMTSNSLVEKHPLKERRKTNKPLLERKRRARINDCLTELKNLVLTSLDKDISRFSKMEKADVLDMTVQYLKACKVRRVNEDNVVSFRAGFNECASEIIHYIMKLDDIDGTTKAKLLSYLATSCKLAESSHGQNCGIQSRSRKPITCSTGSLSPSHSPTHIIPSPTASSPIESHNTSAFSPPISMLPRSPTEKAIVVAKPLVLQQSSHNNRNTFLAPKHSSSQKPMTNSTLPKAPIKPSLWRPW